MGTVETTRSRGLIKSTLIIGSAQGVSILISIVRVKVLAVFLGPSGIGLLSIYNMFQGMVQQVAGFGMESSGVREIASARDEEDKLSQVRRVLFTAHLAQGVLAMAAIWLLRTTIAVWLFGDAERSTEVGLIGVAVLLALLGTAQTALLQGLRRVGDLGRVTVIAAFFGTVVGLFAVWFQGERGIIWFIIVQPMTQVLVALIYTRRLSESNEVRRSHIIAWNTWKRMVKLGAAFMLAKLGTTATLLLVQGRVSQELGLNAAGHFAAAWSITIVYIGVLLGAMGADYYPRMVEVIGNRASVAELVNDQAQLTLALGGPILLLLIGMAPWVIPLLYSDEFAPAIMLLQWQTLGNLFKLISFPISYSIVATGRAKTYLFMELSFNIIFFTVAFSLLPHVGLQVVAYAFVLGYLGYLTCVYLIARRIHAFRFQALSLGMLAIYIFQAVLLVVLASKLPLIAAVTSLFFAVAMVLVGLRIILIKIGTSGRLETRLQRAFSAIRWPLPE